MVVAEMKKVLLFLDQAYKPGIHLGYSALVFLAFQAALVVTAETIWEFGWPTLIGISYLFLINFLIRAADEIKDYDYDKVYNPDRPLIQGTLTHRDLWIMILASAVLGIGISAFVSLELALFALFHAAYSIALVAVEKKFPALGDKMFLSMLVTFPVNIFMNVYTYLLTRDTQGAPEDVRVVLVWLLLFAAAFLQYEIARKTVHARHQKPGLRTYSGTIGTYPSLLLAVGLSLLASLGTIELLAKLKLNTWPLICYFLFSTMILCLYIPRFLKFRLVDEPKKPAMLTGPAMMAMSFYMFFVILYAAAT